MTLEYLKKEHPDIHAEAMVEGVYRERTRIITLLSHKRKSSQSVNQIIDDAIAEGRTVMSTMEQIDEAMA